MAPLISHLFSSTVGKSKFVFLFNNVLFLWLRKPRDSLVPKRISRTTGYSPLKSIISGLSREIQDECDSYVQEKIVFDCENDNVCITSVGKMHSIWMLKYVAHIITAVLYSCVSQSVCRSTLLCRDQLKGVSREMWQSTKPFSSWTVKLFHFNRGHLVVLESESETKCLTSPSKHNNSV